MRNFRLQILFILIILNGFIFSQNDSTLKWKVLPESPALINFGYLWQGANTFELGTRPFMFTNWRNNVSVITNFLFFKNGGSNYIAPKVKFRYYHSFSKQHFFGIAPSVSAWAFFLQGNRYKALTPEISFTFFRVVDISAGYNVFLSGNSSNPLGRYRFGVRYCVF